jgi:hypothetical protein
MDEAKNAKKTLKGKREKIVKHGEMTIKNTKTNSGQDRDW